MAEYENGFDADLRERNVCRFCLAQDVPLTNIYSSKNNAMQVSLSMQIMACSSIEVFADDDMPSTICDLCRSLMEYWYQFKQMCKTADTKLKQFPLTGVLPDRLAHPLYPDALLNHTSPMSKQTLKRRQPTMMTISPPRKIIKTDLDSIPIEEMSVEFADEQVYDEHEGPLITSDVIISNPIKILNNRGLRAVEPVLRAPIFKQTFDGKLEIFTEFMEQEEEIGIDEKGEVAVETNVFPCAHCERSFPLRQLLELHEANHVRDRKFQCDTCQKSFFSKYDLGKHLLIHTGEKPFKCVICSKGFSRSTLLRRHEKVHSDQPKFLCEFCERSFLSKGEWEKHTDNHQKKRPFECLTCGKSFAFKQGLERHEVVHSVDQPFKCEHCGDGFSTQGKLARHLTSHAGERPYPCRLCDKSYLLSHHLTRHMRSHKEVRHTYKCNECDEVFVKRAKLIQHSAVHAAENYSCSLCKETFDSAADIDEHIKLHSESEQYACEFCDMMFLTAEQLQAHSDKEHVHDNELFDADNVSTVDSQSSDFPGADSIESAAEESIVDDASSILDDTSEKSTPKQRASAKSNVSPVKVSPVAKQASPAKKTRPAAAAKPAATVPAAKAPAAKAPPTKAPPTKTPAAKAATSNPAQSVEGTPSTSAKLPIAKSVEPVFKKVLPVRNVEPDRSTKKAANGKEAKKSPPQTSMRSFVTVKGWPSPSNPAPKEKDPLAASNTSSATTTTTTTTTTATKAVTMVKVATTPTGPTKTKPANASPPKTATVPDPKALGMKIVGKPVKVQQVRMTKADIESLKREGKIEMHNGKMIIRQSVVPKKP